MPVILSPNDYDRWLDPAITDAADLQPLLDAYPAAEMFATPVSTHVNNVRNNDAACIAPIAEQQFL
jgi:putative SOS response-associated peptidase YedK